MIPYVARELKGNVNVSPRHPLKEAAKLLAGILAIVAVVYVLLGVAVEALVAFVPDQLESRLAGVFKDNLPRKAVAAAIPAQKLTDELAALAGLKDHYVTYLAPEEDANALALPGGIIVIFSGLEKKLHYEDELAFVLAHELGHFKNRDHLRSLGRALVVFMISAVLLGDNNQATQSISQWLAGSENSFSRRQEAAADLFALELVRKKYGHCAGAVSFMKRSEEFEKIPPFLALFSTHPAWGWRLHALQTVIEKRHYRLGKLKPLPASPQTPSSR